LDKFERAFAAPRQAARNTTLLCKDQLRVAAMRLGRNAVCTVAFGGLVLVGGAACANESAADAIAEKFSRAAEDSDRRDAQAKKAEAERASMAARKVEARRKAEAKRKADERRLAEERKAEEARLADAARVAKGAEEKRLIEERRAEEARKAEASHTQLEASRSEAAEDKFKRAFERGRSTWLDAK
jgi:hypothetical protein